MWPSLNSTQGSNVLLINKNLCSSILASSLCNSPHFEFSDSHKTIPW